jgi:hypothetical protein
LVSNVASGGTLPTSLTVWNDLLYALNAGDSGNITGFVISATCRIIRRGSARRNGLTLF